MKEWYHFIIKDNQHRIKTNEIILFFRCKPNNHLVIILDLETKKIDVQVAADLVEWGYNSDTKIKKIKGYNKYLKIMSKEKKIIKEAIKVIFTEL